MYRNICEVYGLEVPKSKCETSPKVVENDRALWAINPKLGEWLLQVSATTFRITIKKSAVLRTARRPELRRGMNHPHG